MCEVALGMLRVNLSDFLTWECDDYVNAVKGYRKQQSEYWEMVRWIAYYNLVSFNGNKVQIENILLPTDPPKKVEKKAKWRKLK